MLKIFGKIRGQLIERISMLKTASPLMKYLIYAFGEILLVMIGILLAVQVNNWNVSQQQERQEQRILLDLKNEVNLAIESKIKYKNQYQLKVDTLVLALDKLFSDELQALTERECFTVAMTHIMNWEPPIISSVEELVAAGKIDLIRSAELRSKIVLFRSNTQRIQSDLNRAISEGTVLVDLYPNLIIRRWDPEIQSSTFECDVLAIRKDVFFLAQLQSNVGRTGALIRSANEVISSLEEIKELIE